MTEIKTSRDKIPQAYRWNAESVFSDWKAWEQAFTQLENELPEISALKGTLGDTPDSLKQAFELIEGYMKRLGKVTFFAAMSHSVNSRDQTPAEMLSRAQGLRARSMGVLAFLEPELLSLDEAMLNTWVKENESLAYLEHYFNNLFRKRDHVRSEEVEQVLGMVMDPFSAVEMTYGMLTDADFVFPPAVDSDREEKIVSQGTFQRLLNEPDRALRKSAWESYHGEYRAHSSTLAANLAASIKQCVFKSRVRRFPDSLTGVLSADNIPVEVFHNLINTFQKNLPLWHRYWRIRRKLLGVDHLHPYDIWAPLSDSKPVILYDQALEWITAGLAPMGAAYVETLRSGVQQERWVDVYPTDGKQAGAFSYGTHGTHPFICMSYNDTLLSLSTLAHELGHSMHSYLAWQNQPVLYGEYSLFAAEVASNFHQALVRDSLLKRDDAALRIAVLEEAMSNFHRYFFLMPTLARLELDLHRRVERGQGITADCIMKRTVELFEEGYGGEMDYDPDLLGMMWASFGHLYEDYYVYQYATGISGAHALAARVLSGEENAVEDYMGFLKAGGSLYPIEALQRAGVDLLTPAPVEAAFEVLSGIIGQLEALA
ncbi:MAG: oligoendopeptidase F [Anaerolineales bacterium]|nr:oligoendopeptidase F [Anaerolineales bacterium]